MKDISWQAALILACLGFAQLALLIAIWHWPPKRRNKRKGLPAPRPDSRNSIEQFQRTLNHG